jgi:hypothetical protein
MKQASWKTNTAGIGAILGALGAICTGIAHDNFGAVATALPALIAGIGLLCARDNDKTSEEVGASK